MISCITFRLGAWRPWSLAILLWSSISLLLKQHKVYLEVTRIRTNCECTRRLQWWRYQARACLLFQCIDRLLLKVVHVETNVFVLFQSLIQTSRWLRKADNESAVIISWLQERLCLTQSCLLEKPLHCVCIFAPLAVCLEIPHNEDDSSCWRRRNISSRLISASNKSRSTSFTDRIRCPESA